MVSVFVRCFVSCQDEKKNIITSLILIHCDDQSVSFIMAYKLNAVVSDITRYVEMIQKVGSYILLLCMQGH